MSLTGVSYVFAFILLQSTISVVKSTDNNDLQGNEVRRLYLNCGRQFEIEMPLDVISVTVFNGEELLAHADLSLAHGLQTKLTLNITTLNNTVLNENFLSKRTMKNTWEIKSGHTVYILMSAHVEVIWSRDNSSSVFSGINSWCGVGGG